MSLSRTLTKHHIEILEAGGAHDILKTIDRKCISLLLLNNNYSGISGMSPLEFIRNYIHIPSIMIGNDDCKQSRIAALEAGAEDYFAKPLDEEEVLARINAIMRRTLPEMVANFMIHSPQTPCNSRIVFDKWIAVPEKFELRALNGEPCDLTSGEFALLMLFLKNPQKVLSRDDIAGALQGHEWSPFDRSIDNQVSRLRKKIEADPAEPRMIKTIRGCGYAFVADTRKL